MKMMAIVGSGGKALKFYVFGPECQCQCDRFRPRLCFRNSERKLRVADNFPGNCYSEELVGNPHLLDSIAKGNGMIGAAEELLWPAERVPSKVGIIYPRSSFFWDEQDVELPRGIMDCVRW